MLIIKSVDISEGHLLRNACLTDGIGLQVCTRNSDLKDVVDRVPPRRRHDLVRYLLYVAGNSSCSVTSFAVS